MPNPAVRRGREIARRAPIATPVTGTGQNIVPGSNGIPILTVVITDYAGNSRDEAAEQVWGTWTRRYPGALIQVVHGDQGYEVLR